MIAVLDKKSKWQDGLLNLALNIHTLWEVASKMISSMLILDDNQESIYCLHSLILIFHLSNGLYVFFYKMKKKNTSIEMLEKISFFL
jgi:hypothetical protein